MAVACLACSGGEKNRNAFWDIQIIFSYLAWSTLTRININDRGAQAIDAAPIADEDSVAVQHCHIIKHNTILP